MSQMNYQVGVEGQTYNSFAKEVARDFLVRRGW